MPLYERGQNMNFTAGLIAGSIVAAIGVGMLMSDNKTRKKVVKGSRKAMRKTENIISDVSDMF